MAKNINTHRSVYHRAKLLAPIFPWLLFNGVFQSSPPSSSSLPAASHRLPISLSIVAHAAPVAAPSPSNGSGSRRLRGRAENAQHAVGERAINGAVDSSNINLASAEAQDGSSSNSRQLAKTVQNYCGLTWNDANSHCLRPCPDGESTFCDYGESCFADLASCPSMEVLSPQEQGLMPPQPASLSFSAGNLGGDGGGGWGHNFASAEAAEGGGSVASTFASARTQGTLPFQVGTSIPSSCHPTLTNSVNVGYYQSWAKYRASSCHPLVASQIPVKEFGYTHLIYSFAGISSYGELQPYNGVMDEVTLYKEFNSLKSSNEGLLTLIAVGGWNLDQTLFGKAASNPSRRQKFAQSVVRFVQEYNFDGLDLDWEYPVTRQGTPADYDNYPLLVQAIREAFDATGRTYLLTMAIPMNPTKLDTGFNLRDISKYVDWFHLMSYDIHGSWDDVAGSNTDMEYIDSAIQNNILNKGVKAEQLVFGMAAYGRSMELSDASCTTVGCPISGAGMPGCSGEDGFSPYFELKEQYVDTRNYDSLLLNERTLSMEMVLDGGNVFVSLDVEDSFELKREYYLSKCFRGQMWWALDMIKDPPFRSSASLAQGGQVPAAAFSTTTHASAASVLSNNKPPPHASPSGANAPPIAAPPDMGLKPAPLQSLASAPGVIQDDNYCSHTTGQTLAPVEDCAGFVFCQNGYMSGSITMCHPGLVFDNNMGICNWPSETNICGFEFCPNKMSGYVPFEECTRFYYCKAGHIDGDIDVCPDGTLFDIGMGICNWASTVTCQTMAPSPKPTTPAAIVQPVHVPVVEYTPAVVVQSEPAAVTPRPTFGTVAGAFAANKPFAGGVWGAEGSTSSLEQQVARLRFTPTDDAYVQENEPYANHNDRFIVIDENQRYDGLLRFYVQGLEDRSVEYVKLRLYVSNKGPFGGNFWRCRNDWHEDMVNWDKAPSIQGSQPLAVVNAVLLDEWVEVDLTGLVKEDGPVSLRITSDSTDNIMYSSKENDNGNSPELIVGVEPVQAANSDMEERDAPTVTNTFRIGPTDDAFVWGGATTADKNYGDHQDLKIDMDNGYKKAYLRFDFSRVSINAMQSAKLRLYATDSSPSGGMFTTVTDSDWNEDTITYDNAPPCDGENLGLLEDIQSDKWYELDITQAVSESRPLTICILGNHDDKVMYSSKDGGPYSPEVAVSLEEFVPLSTRGEQVMELLPTDDATVALGAPDLNFGTDDELMTDTQGEMHMHNFLLRFDAKEVPRGEVTSATLRLYATNKEPSFGGMFIETKRSQWDERSVTWNNAPSSDGKVLGSLMEVEYGTWYDLDVTSAVLGGSSVSFRASSPHFNAATYGSRESSYQPRLIVHYSPPAPIPDDLDLYIPTDDTSILMEKPEDNFGRNEELKVDGYGGVFNSLIKFDLTAIEKGTVETAILRLYAVDGSPSGGTFVVTQNKTWKQHSVTWNTAPAADGIILETLGEVVPYRWYEIDLGEIAQDLGGEALSIRIAPSHGLRCAYSSSRDRLGHLPQLLIKEDLFKGMG